VRRPGGESFVAHCNVRYGVSDQRSRIANANLAKIELRSSVGSRHHHSASGQDSRNNSVVIVRELSHFFLMVLRNFEEGCGPVILASRRDSHCFATGQTVPNWHRDWIIELAPSTPGRVSTAGACYGGANQGELSAPQPPV